ncbi:MAG: 3-ketoacyl-ACP reductase [Acidobacteria bacterium]|nr:MAG: 3-ketoacyl-ACP reductase [Acidobacteriota bacterium]
MSPASPPSAAALVTGASRGLGRGIAEALSRDGLDIAIHYGTRRAAAEETEAACRKIATRAGQKFALVAGDVARAEDRRRILDETLAALGRIDALVNNAGIAPRVRADILEATEASFDELIAVNLKGPYFLSQLVARHWLDHRGESRLPGGYKLVFVSSASAARASVNRGDYCVSKAGLAMAAKLWAARLAGEGAQVYELRPGIMATDMTAAVKEKYDRMIAEGAIPQGRWGTAEDVGLAVSALLKGSLPFSTGEVINVDGGLHIERL